MQKSLKKEYFLWQLWNIEKDTEKANEEVDTVKGNREELVQELSDYEREARLKKKEQTKYLKEIEQCEKKIAEKNNRVDKNVSSISPWMLFLSFLTCISFFFSFLRL